MLAVPADTVPLLALVECATVSWRHGVGRQNRVVALHADLRDANITPVTDDGRGQIGGRGEGDGCAGGDASPDDSRGRLAGPGQRVDG